MAETASIRPEFADQLKNITIGSVVGAIIGEALVGAASVGAVIGGLLGWNRKK